MEPSAFATARIAVAGNVNADLTYQLPRQPEPGETLLAEGLTLGPGGKAANAAVALARLGAAPLLLGSVGEDPLGSLVLDALRRAGVATERVVRSREALTGVACVLVAAAGENAIVTHLGANLAWGAGELPSLDGYGALLMTLGLPHEVLLALRAKASAAGLLIVVDATPLRGEEPGELLAADVLSANRVEAEQLTGRALDVADEDAIRRACGELRALGAGAAVLKLGEAGAAWMDDSGYGRVCAPTVRAVDPTGAGDAFMAGLTAALQAGAGLPAAVRFACLLGALSTTGRGAQGGWSTLGDVQRFAATAGLEGALR
jgi:ribokinase